MMKAYGRGVQRCSEPGTVRKRAQRKYPPPLNSEAEVSGMVVGHRAQTSS